MGLSSLTKSEKILLVSLLLVVIAIPLTLYLSQKTTIFKPRAQEVTQTTHSVVNFDSTQEQILSPGDTLEGKGIPNGKVSISITPDGANGEATVNTEGKWTYQIPPTIQPKNYNLTIILEDIAGNIASIKTYSIRVTSLTSSLQGVFKTPRMVALSEVEGTPRAAGPLRRSSSEASIASGDARPRWNDWQSLLIKPAYAQGTPPIVCNPNNPQCPAGFNCIRADPSNPLGYCTNQATPSPSPPRQLEALGPEYSGWLTWMRHLSIYPAWDRNAGEIVYVNRETYEKEVCGNPDPTGPRCTTSGQVDLFISQIESRNWAFLQHFAGYLRQLCYVPAPVMEPYFPDLTNIVLDNGQTVNFFNQDDFNALRFLHSAEPHCNDIVPPTDVRYIKRSIENEQELGRLITQAGANFAFSQEDPLGDFFHATEVATLGFFPTSTMLKLVALKSSNETGYLYNNEVVKDAAFAITGFIPPTKVGGVIQQISRIGNSIVITTRTVMHQQQMAQRVRTIRNAIQAGEGVSKEAVEQEIARYVGDIELTPIRPSVPWPEYLKPKGGYARQTYEVYLEPHIKAGAAYLVNRADESLVQSVKAGVLNTVNAFIARTGRSISLDAHFRDALDNRRIFTVDNSIFDKIWLDSHPGFPIDELKHIPAFKREDMVIIRNSEYRWFALHGGLNHEVWHLIGTRQDFLGLPYRQGILDSEIYKALNLVYEIMTDYGSDISRGITPFSSVISINNTGYVTSNPAFAKGIYDRLIRKYPVLLDDLIEFSLTGDGQKLMSAISQRTGKPATDAEFLRWFKEDAKINPSAIKVLVSTSIIATPVVGAAFYPLPKEPTIEVQSDIFIGDEDEEIEIIGVVGQGNTRTVSFVVHDGGFLENSDLFDVTFALEPTTQTGSSNTVILSDYVKWIPAFAGMTKDDTGLINTAYAQGSEIPLQSTKLSSGLYQINLSNVPPGNYNLIANLFRTGSTEELDEDSEPITITSSTIQTPSPTPQSSPTPSPSVITPYQPQVIIPSQTGCIRSPAFTGDGCTGYRLITNLQYSACYNLGECLINQGDGTCVNPPVFQGDACTGYRVMPGISGVCYNSSDCQPKRVTSVKVNGEEVDLSVDDPEVDIDLTGIPETPRDNIPVLVDVTYSDGSSRVLTLLFNYLINFPGKVPSTPSTAPLPPETFTGPGSSIPPSSSPAPLPASLFRCGLSANGSNTDSSIAVGNNISFRLNGIPEGASSAQWEGTGGSVPSPVSGFSRGTGGVWTVIYGPYEANSLGTYTRKITVFNINGEPICQSNTVNINVLSSISPAGQCISYGNACGSFSGSNARLSCCSNYVCSSTTSGTCQPPSTTGTVPTPLPVGVTPTIRPSPTSTPYRSPTPPPVSCSGQRESCNTPAVNYRACCLGTGVILSCINNICVAR